MPIPAIVAGALTWLGRIGLAAFAVNEVKNLTSGQVTKLEQSRAGAAAEGFPIEEQDKLIAATTYEQVEKDGQDPVDFWEGLSEEEKARLQFSPQSLQASLNRTTFLGMSSALMFTAALVASGVGGIRGMPVLTKTISEVGKLRAAGASASAIRNVLEAGKLAAIKKIWIPGMVATIASAAGWLSSSMVNNLNDAELWGRIFLGQAADDFEKAQTQGGGFSGSGGSGGSGFTAPKTIIRVVEDRKPEQFLGTLFSSKLGRAESFERKLDDKITDADDLEEDVKINLNRWLASLPNRMGYSVVIRKDPVDEFGTKQSGIWATLTLFMTHISGKTTPIDTILLGPVEPQVRLELQKRTQTIENQLDEFIDATKVSEIQIPGGSIDIFGADGQRVTPSGALPGGASTPTPTATLPTQRAGESKEDFRDRLAEEVKRLEELVAERTGSETSATTGGGAQKTSSTTPSEPRKSESQPTPQSTGFKRGDSVVVDASKTDGQNLNVRAFAGTSGRIVGKLPPGTTAVIDSGAQRTDGFTWHIITNASQGLSGTGWIATEFVTKR